MCAIAGLIGLFDPRYVQEMCRLQAHRGPDDEGFYHDQGAGVSLGHRRLSIIDPEHGRQPMCLAGDDIVIVFNGEIFNAPELRRDLESQGCRFTTRNSDTETLLHLYRSLGPDMLGELNGMFAFAIYDRARRGLLLARDRAGIKPLYHARGQGGFAFASELKALAPLPFVSRDIRPQALYHYLSLQCVPSPGSILAGADKLPAAHALWYDIERNEAKTWRYWRPVFAPDHGPTPEQWARRLGEAIKGAVRRWTLSDVPIACSLSGGLDSSSVVGLLSQTGGEPVSTYSLGFSGAGAHDLDELRQAATVAKRWGTKHHEITLSADTLPNDLEAMVRCLDEPYAGGLPSWYVFKLIGRDCKVAMTGTGGDELFGNYGKWLRYEAGPQAGQDAALGQSLGDKSALLAAQAANPHGALYHRYLSDALKDQFLPLAASIPGQDKTEALIERLWREAGSDSPRDAVAAVDFALQLPDEFLHMTDRFSMAHGVEARTPFLDNELVATAFCVPAALRTKPGDLKYLLKMACAGVIPKEIVNAPKRGFVLPLAAWTRTSLRARIEAALCPSALAAQGIFSPKTWEMLVAPHLSGERNHTEQVWTLYMFQLWYEQLRAGA